MNENQCYIFSENRKPHHFHLGTHLCSSTACYYYVLRLMKETIQWRIHCRCPTTSGQKPVQLRRPGHRPSGLPSGSESCIYRNVHGIRMLQELHRPEPLPAKTPQLPKEPAQFSQEKRTITPSVPHVPVNHGLTVAARMRLWQRPRLDTTPPLRRQRHASTQQHSRPHRWAVPTKEQAVLFYR